MRRPIALMALCVVALSACGESEEDKARSLAESIAAGSPSVCDNMTDRFRSLVASDRDECRQRMREIGKERIELRDVSINGDKATITAVSGGGEHRGSLTLRKQDGEWRLAAIRSQEEPEPSAPKAKITEGLGPMETVAAYYDAIRAEDGPALCGLLSVRYAAKEVVGSGDPRTAISDCVEGLQTFDWSTAQKRAHGVEPVAVKRSGNAATVTLSNRREAKLKRQNGRWVIDDLRE